MIMTKLCVLSLRYIKYRLTTGDHHRLPYKKHLESVTILGLPVSVCSELHFLSDSCQVAKGKAVGWSRYVTISPATFPIAAPADDLRAGTGIVRAGSRPSPALRASSSRAQPHG